MTDIYLHSVARMADYIATHPYALCARLSPQLPLDAEARVPWQLLADSQQKAAHKLGLTEIWPTLLEMAPGDELSEDEGEGNDDESANKQGSEYEEMAEQEEDEGDTETASRSRLYRWREARHTAMAKWARGQAELVAAEFRSASWAFEAGLSALAAATPYAARDRLAGDDREQVGQLLDEDEREFKVRA